MSKWLDYINWEKRVNKMSMLWVLDVPTWISNNAKSKDTKKILDYGCSYFYTGEALAQEFQEVHGYDIDQKALDKAALKQIANTTFYNHLAAIPNENFDIIVVSSVIQYFGNLDEVDRFFLFATQKLKKNNQSILVIADIIPKNYIAWKDALENIYYAAVNGILLPMLAHLYKATFSSSDIQLLKINKDEISHIAEKNGFKVNILKKNLTLSRRRYSCIFTLA